ncbi:hypothetical protein DV515_00004193, partial [Chloebia gouldiae]
EPLLLPKTIKEFTNTVLSSTADGDPPQQESSCADRSTKSYTDRDQHKGISERGKDGEEESPSPWL